MYRTNTFPLVHAGFFHAFMNILALTPLLERFEAEYGTLTTLALFLGRMYTPIWKESHCLQSADSKLSFVYHPGVTLHICWEGDWSKYNSFGSEVRHINSSRAWFLKLTTFLAYGYSHSSLWKQSRLTGRIQISWSAQPRYRPGSLPLWWCYLYLSWFRTQASWDIAVGWLLAMDVSFSDSELGKND